ncbi:unnamed protein product [Rhizoctonia solani]|uniref:RraA-like protein n=1 Tax=Rhizoctonia solani TaxID=456999 RepID=A0A8H2X7C3_9AGAM|nr:unnamed protein product [Rhizoctonia solani]
MQTLPIRNLNYRFPILKVTRKSILLHRRMTITGYPTPAELPSVASRRLHAVSKHINFFALMSGTSPFNILVWNPNRPERPPRERPNTRMPNALSQVVNFERSPNSNPPTSSPSGSPPSTSTSASYTHSHPRSHSYAPPYINSYQASQSEMEVSTSVSPQPSLIEQLGPFSTCEISDALIKLGLTHNASESPVQRGGYIPDINMLSPSPTVGDGQNTRVCGYAYTVKMVRGDDLRAPKPAQHFVDAAPAGSVAVISVPPNIKSAAWGGLMTAGAQFRGVHGVVIDGRARDLIEHRAAGFPVFARGHSTLGQSPFTRPSELNVPVTILPRPDFEGAFENTFSAVEVHPGDIIVADIDGVVCIPPELLASVIDSCRYSKQVDEKCMIDIQQGRSIQETFQDWRKATKKKDNVASWNGEILAIKSNWLQNINGEVIECRDHNALGTLLSCDHIILVTDNIRRLSAPGLQDALDALHHAPSVSMVITERAPGVPVPMHEFGDTKPTVIKPDLAIRGLDAFTQGDVNQYQALAMASGLPHFAQTISSLYTESNQPSSPSSTASRAAVRTSTHIARAAFSACEAAIDNAQQSITNTLAPLEPLKAEVSSISHEALHSTLRGSTTVREGVTSVEARLRAAFRRLPWYSLWWRADEVSSALGEAVSWNSLNTQLSFHSGRLATIRERMYHKAVVLAAVSPLLNNRLAQIHARTPIDPDALSSPLDQRTAQLFAPGGPVEDVQRKAQAAVMATAVNMLGSGALRTIASVRWMQSMWARAEKRWWADWARVCAGLERDCESNLNQVVQERVMGSVTAGIQGMEALAAQRADTVSVLRQEMAELNKELTALEQRLK